MTLSPTVPCGSCGAPIVWFTTAAGRPMPLNPEPAEDGNIELNSATACNVLGKKALAEARVEGVKLYKTHFSSCPNAGQHRKRK